MHTLLEASRLLLYQALAHVQTDKRSMRWSAAALTFGSEASTRVALDAIQIFGGYGYMRDLPAGASRPGREAPGDRRWHLRDPPPRRGPGAPRSRLRRGTSVSVSLRYDGPPEEVVFLRRPNRFLAEVRPLEGGVTRAVHVPNPGRMVELLVPGETRGFTVRPGIRRAPRPRRSFRSFMMGPSSPSIRCSPIGSSAGPWRPDRWATSHVPGGGPSSRSATTGSTSPASVARARGQFTCSK